MTYLDTLILFNLAVGSFIIIIIRCAEATSFTSINPDPSYRLHYGNTLEKGCMSIMHQD